MMKPFLLSAFVFPGAGYYLLKKPIHGTISALLVLGIVVVFVKDTLYRSNIISQRIINGDITLDVAAIREAILTTPGNVDPATLSLLTYFFGAVWLWGMVDCYRLAKKSDKLIN
ncbi:MAG: hypothetical protein ACJA0N_001535 [Pseudohongiellaceae bacterium]|jgi:hypothetical protein